MEGIYIPKILNRYAYKKFPIQKRCSNPSCRCLLPYRIIYNGKISYNYLPHRWYGDRQRKFYCSEWCKECDNLPKLHFCKKCGKLTEEMLRKNGEPSGVYRRLCDNCWKPKNV